MARRRDYAAEYARRQALARQLGYQGYYARRIRVGAPPSAPAPRGERLRFVRGHAGPADLARALRQGRVAAMFQEPVGERDPGSGQYREVRLTAQLSDGSQRSFRLRGAQLDSDRMRPLRSAAAAGGVDLYLNPSLDVIGLLAGDRVTTVAYTVVLVDVRRGRLGRVRAEVRDQLGVTWKRAREIVAERPATILDTFVEEEASESADRLEVAGAVVLVEEQTMGEEVAA